MAASSNATAALTPISIKTQELYVLGRHSLETQRLNSQHEFVKQACDGHALHPSIARESIVNVANVACGTGIWLQDVASQLPAFPAVTGQKRHFHGFDISSAQFPKVGLVPATTTFTVHDVLKPFPEQELRIYDVVQVRFLVLGVKKVDVATAVKNVTELLRPGGHLQWIDQEMHLGARNPPEFLSAWQVILDFGKNQGLSGCFGTDAKAVCENLGLEDVRFEDRAIALRDKGHAKELVQIQFLGCMQALIPLIFLKNAMAANLTEGEALFTATEKDIVDAFGKGVVPELPVVLVLARKPTVIEA